MKKNSSYYMELESRYGASIYKSIPVVLEKGKGIYVWDMEGKRYLDCLSGYSALNLGHCHPRLLKVLQEQSEKLTLISRAFYSKSLSEYEEFVTKFFSYEKVLPMNTGVEAVETAVKLCRKWAYTKKKIPKNKAKIIFFESNFHGRSVLAISASTDPVSREGFGPHVPGIEIIPYNNLEALEKALSSPEIAGIVIEPIQGEAGVRIPSPSYLKKSYELCRERNVLFIADEIQTGLGRTGKILACEHENVRADILLLGKALSGGILPVSAVLADSSIMDCFQLGEHGSTYGGNPLACAVAREALSILHEENLISNAEKMGNLFREELSSLSYPWIQEWRGKGLLNALEIKENAAISAWDTCLELKKHGILAKATKEHIIRFSPPLTITEEEMREALELIKNALQAMQER